MTPQARKHEQGTVMIAVLLLVAVFGTLSTALLNGDRQVSQTGIDDAANMQAIQAAAGGVEQARWHLQSDPKFSGEEIRIGKAMVVVGVVRAADPPSAWQVTATATCMPRGANGLPRRHQVVVDLAASDGLPRVVRWH